MSLSRLPLPSISRVLEGEVDMSAKSASAQENMDSSMSPGSQASESSLPPLVPQVHLMKTINFRGNDLENEEVELFSLKVGFPDEPPADKGDAQTIFEERREADIVNVAIPQEGEQERAPNRWPKITFSQMLMVIRQLFPFRVAEVLLRKAGRELAKYFTQR